MLLTGWGRGEGSRAARAMEDGWLLRGLFPRPAVGVRASCPSSRDLPGTQAKLPTCQGTAQVRTARPTTVRSRCPKDLVTRATLWHTPLPPPAGHKAFLTRAGSGGGRMGTFPSPNRSSFSNGLVCTSSNRDLHPRRHLPGSFYQPRRLTEAVDSNRRFWG